MDRRAFVTILATAALATSATRALAQGGAAPRPPDQRPRWGTQAEQEFRLGRGMGPRLMTEEEWKEHQEKMRTMTQEERQRYREETHERMLERARERGITTMPGMPGPRRPGGRPGS